MKISDAAKLLGISTDTIRYYEKEGVITPKRTSKNNYRDLDNRDIISLLICIYNRKIGYSMKESVEYVEGIPVSKITDILNKKIDELELEVKETKNLINYLTTLKMESEIDFYNIGNYWITVEPKCYLLPYAKISQSEICFTKDNPRYYAKLFEYLPFINQAQVTNVENICEV
jgi:DNA-binding transcriptional MerR regulator